jgi:hypothetical protein
MKEKTCIQKNIPLWLNLFADYCKIKIISMLYNKVVKCQQ